MKTKELSFVAQWRNAVRDSGLPRTAKLIAFVLSTYLSGDGKTGAEPTKRPSIVTLARGASLGPERRHTKECASRSGDPCDCRQPKPKDNTATKNAINQLEAAGFLEVERVRGQSGWRYVARIPRPPGGSLSPAATGESSERIPRADTDESPAYVARIPRPHGDESEVESEVESGTPSIGERAAQLRTSKAIAGWLRGEGGVLADDARSFKSEALAKFDIAGDLADEIRRQHTEKEQ